MSKTSTALTTTEVFGPAMDVGSNYRLDCELTAGGAARLTVTQFNGTTPQGLGTRTDATPSPGIYVIPDDIVSIGKKPRDTSNGDTFAGDIDNMKISRWEP